MSAGAERIGVGPADLRRAFGCCASPREAVGSDLAPPALVATAFHTSDPATAERETERLLSPHRLRVHGSTAEFDARVNRAVFVDVTLLSIDYGTGVTVERPTEADYVVVLLPLTGHLHVRHQRQEFIAIPRQTAAVLSPGTGMTLSFSPGCGLLSLRADAAAFERTLRRLAPDHDACGSVRFEPVVHNATHAVDALYGVARLLQGVVENPQTRERIPPVLAEQLREQALSTVLTVQPHSSWNALFGPTAAVSARIVREALDIMASETAGVHTIGSIARRVGVGVRALELGFRKELGRSPRAHLHEMRLGRAHDELVRAQPTGGVTVTDVALRWGFAHTGRFAAYHRERFDEMPSQTLRRPPA